MVASPLLIKCGWWGWCGKPHLRWRHLWTAPKSFDNFNVWLSVFSIWSCNAQFMFNFVIYFLIQKDSNHPDWATGRPSGSPVAKLMIFDLFFASLRCKLKCIIWKNMFWYLNLTGNFHYNHEQISSYPKVRSPPSSKRYLGLFAKTYNTGWGVWHLFENAEKLTLKYMLER